MHRSRGLVTWVGGVLLLSLAACSTHFVSSTAGASDEIVSVSQFESIDDALAYIGTKMNGPILFPTALPPGARLDEQPVSVQHMSDGTVDAVLDLVVGRHDQLEIIYGAPSLAGCDYPSKGAHEVSVGRYPALLKTWAGGWQSLVLWPATLDKLRGRYELRGSFSGPEIMRMARSMRPVPGLAPTAARPGC